MKALDLAVIEQARAWCRSGTPVWLCTVLSTFGSAPRGPGALLVATDAGEHCGSLSGGCVEEDLLQRFARGAFERHTQTLRYGEGGLAPNLTLPCGGVLDVLLEYLPADADSDAQLEALQGALNGGGHLLREVPLNGRRARWQPAPAGSPRVEVEAGRALIRVGAAQRLLLAGWSPVAEYCARFALALGHEVVLCEPRDEVLAGIRVEGLQVLPTLPARYIAEGGCHAATAVVALTHDPRLDDLTLLEAVRTEAFYIGAMGSQRTSAKRFERLARIGGLSAAQLARIHAPIGLHLGSKTPAEIGLAVMADVLRVANGVARSAL